MIKICIFSHCKGIKGGAERVILEMIDSLIDKKVKFLVISPLYGEIAKEVKKRNMDFKIIPFVRWVYLRRSVIFKRVMRIFINCFMVIPCAIIVKIWKADLIVSNTITINIGAFTSKLCRIPHIWYIHEFGYEDHGFKYDLGQIFSLWIINKFSDICIVNSLAVKRKYSRYIPSQKLKMIYYAVEFVPKSKLNPPFKLNRREKIDIKCAIIGALKKEKGQEDAIKAIAELIKKGIKTNLYIVGTGGKKYRNYLKNLVKELHLENHVIFLGYIPNPLPIINFVDIILVCSKNEAFGRVTIESMKNNKLVIGTRSGGTKELIKENFNGFLYTYGNYKELSEKILFFYKYPEIIKIIRKNGENWAKKNFNMEIYGKEIYRLITSIILKSKSKR